MMQFSLIYRLRTLFLFAVSATTVAAGMADAGENLLRNGSFEGGKRYWYETDDKELVRGDAAQGDTALRIAKGGVQSAAFTLKPGVPVTISFSAKAEAETTVGWQCTPCSREIGCKLGQTWSMKHFHPVELGTTWKRYSVKFTPSAAQDGFWPRPTYMIQLGDGDKPWLLDAVTVAYDAGADAYIPYREVEAYVDSPDLKGYRDASANLFERSAVVNLVGTASNPGDKPREVTLRLQLMDYEGRQAVGKPYDSIVVIPPGKAVETRVPMKLSATGLVLARCSVLAGGKVVDSSDLPLCSLPYPKSATAPDPRERFGGSLFGLHGARQYQKIGMGWTRWFPHMNWADHQPESADRWIWFDRELDDLAALGISTHAVLYGKPKWAFHDDKQQLPKDMQWPASDSRWDDLTPQCGWDRFIVNAVKHYRGKSLVYEIENEPEFDGWDNAKDLYAKFTIRTARLIKRTDPKARVMVNNVYGIPSGLNRYLLERGAGKWIDIISWHDYHDGWLADATAVRRMRGALDDLGCRHMEIWFNEGWAYTNTAVDEPAVALTNFDSAQATNAMVASIAELTCNGQEKTILFLTNYEEHGMSFWDYCGPGTLLWDYYGYPLPLVPAWNVMCHHLGLSRPVAFARPEGANFCIFDDLRNHRGVVVAYADREAPRDVTVELPADKWVAEDAMGNATPLDGSRLVLSRSGRPVFLYSTAKTAGKQFALRLAPLDRKNASFVRSGGATASYRLPSVWEGKTKDSTEGNPAVANGKPIWRLDQVWPADPNAPANYRPLSWRDGWWLAREHTFGGQPKAEMKDGAIRMEFRAPHQGSPGEKLCGLVFIAPQAGEFDLAGAAELKLWDGGNPVRLSILHKTKDAVKEVASISLVRDQQVSLAGVCIALAANEELVLLPRIEGMYTGGDVTLRGLTIAIGGAGRSYRLPQSWQGDRKGTAEGNPISVSGRPVWRLDHVWPDDPVKTGNYTPLPWNGVAWQPGNGAFGGQPEVRVENGAFQAAVRGSWTGNEGQRIAALVFISPKSAVYTASGLARSKPWEGGAKTFRLGLFKKDTQRAVLLKTIEMPRDGSAVPLQIEVELTAGHELVFLPLMPDWHNATNTSIENLVIEERH